MARGKPEEFNPKRRPRRTFKRIRNVIGYGTVGGPMLPGVPPRKPTDPIPDDELMDELKKAFPGSTEINNQPEAPPTESGDMGYE